MMLSMSNSDSLEHTAAFEYYYCAPSSPTPKHYPPSQRTTALRSIMTILEKVEFDPRTVGFFQRHETTTSISLTEKQIKEKENERFNHFSSIMDVPKRLAQTQEIGPLKKKAGGMEISPNSLILGWEVWIVSCSNILLSGVAPAAPRILRSMSVSINDGFAPPANFALVGGGGVYRSSFPRVENFGYLKRLGLKSIL